MKKTSAKKTISIFLALTLILAMMPAHTFGAEEANEQELTTITEDGQAIQEGEEQEEPSVMPQETAPTPPTVSAAVNGEGIIVSWSAIEGATSYIIYRSYSPNGKKSSIANTKNTSYRDIKVESGRTAYYFVKADNVADISEPAECKIIRVYIETGHGKDSRGKWDPGCKWKKYQEAKLMLPIARSMTKYMRNSGVYVYTDAYSGNNINLTKTLKFLNSHSVSAFVNIHCDYKKAPRGTLPLYRTAEQKKLANCLNKGVHSTITIKNRGLQKRKNLDTLNSKKVRCTSCLFETGNIKKDNKILRTNYDKYGKGLAKGLCNYLGVRFTP